MKRILEELSIMHIKLDTILDISDKNTDLDDEIDYLHNSLNWFKTKLSDIEAKNKTSEANLNIGVVSNRREQLLSFLEWYRNEQPITCNHKFIIDKYLNLSNCC